MRPDHVIKMHNMWLQLNKRYVRKEISTSTASTPTVIQVYEGIGSGKIPTT